MQHTHELEHTHVGNSNRSKLTAEANIITDSTRDASLTTSFWCMSPPAMSVHGPVLLLSPADDTGDGFEPLPAGGAVNQLGTVNLDATIIS